MSIIAGWQVSEGSFSQFSGKASRALRGVSNEHCLSPSLAIGFDGRDNNTCSFSLWSQNNATLLLLSLSSVGCADDLGSRTDLQRQLHIHLLMIPPSQPTPHLLKPVQSFWTVIVDS